MQISELGITVNLLHEILKSDFGNDPTRLIWIIDEVEGRYVHQTGAREVCQALREAAFEPIGAMLVEFLLKGDLSGDIFGELFITRSNDNFVLVERKSVPRSLSHMTENILSAGESAHLLNRIGVHLSGRFSEIIDEMRVKPCKLLDSNFSTVAIRETRSFLNKELLTAVNQADLLVREIQLYKKFFFISESDWYLEFLSTALLDLEKPVKSINKVRLNDAMKSVSGGKVSIVFHKFPLDQLWENAVERMSEDPGTLTVRALTVIPRSSFPLNVIFTDAINYKFQSVFRHLFFCKYIESKLGALWSEFHALHSLEANESLIACHFLLQRMLHFVKNYLIFLTVDVIESKAWDRSVGKSVFAVRDDINHKMDSIMEEMAITSPLYKSVNKVLSTCGLFSAHMTRFVQILLSQSEDRQEQAVAIEQASRQDKYLTLISKFQDAYEGQINSFMVQLKQQSTPSNSRLITRLDFSQYFSETMGI